MGIADWLAQLKFRGSGRVEADLTELLLVLAPPQRGAPLASVAVASSEGGAGSTTAAPRLAEALARHLDARVLLVDADQRAPRLHEVYGAPREPGLREVLRGDVALAAATRPTLVCPGLDLLPAGTASVNLGEVLSHQGLERALAGAASTYACVVLDVGALLASQETALLARCAEGVLLAVAAAATQGEQLVRAERLLQRSGANLLGVVVNDPRGEFVRDEA
jgi:tyrosine-protein kinase Etk/Wzc